MRTSSPSSLLRAALPAAAASLLLLAGCTPDQPVPARDASSLDLTQYLAVGDSYTAGYADGGLTLASQSYSYPNLLASQFAKVQPSVAFAQPLLSDGAGTGYLSLNGFDGNGQPRTRRVRPAATLGRYINPTSCLGADTVYRYPRAASTLPQNLGVPGLRLTQIETPGLGNAANLNTPGQFNPYFERLLPAADSRTYLQAVTAASANATFFTYFMGLDEVLPYVVSGGNCGPLPSASVLRQNAVKLLNQLAANGRPGIIASPPDLATLPVLRLSNAVNLQERLRASKQQPAYTIYIKTSFGGAVQPATANDYILPSGQSRLGRLEPVTVNGATVNVAYGDQQNPVSGADALDYNEFTRINQVITTVRTDLETLARTTYKLPYVDTQIALFSQVDNLINVNGVTYTPELVRGNFYSLDRFSLTPRGNALLANVFLRKINESYNTNIPLLNVNSLPTQTNP